ncbi:hypothetical protein JW964_11635 [candidate division KSB1 bacterium]|nr:hypothetical protein [candidate division KSB1 bacterium]
MAENKSQNLLFHWEETLRRLIVDYPARARKFWHRDHRSIDDYIKSVEPNRAKWQEMMRFPEVVPLPFEAAISPAEENQRFIHLNLLPGVELAAIYQEPDERHFTKPFPLVICLHGMFGTADMVMGNDGYLDASYHQFGQKLVENGFAVIVPQLINNFKDRARINRMALLLGATIWGLEIQVIRSLIDIAIAQLPIHPEKIAIWGISMGGAYTLYTMPIESRVKLGIISAWFNKRVDKMVIESPHYSCFLPTDEEHAFIPGLLTQFSDSDLVSLICPRHLQIQTGKKDNVSWHTLVAEEFNNAKYHYEQLGISERLEWCLHEGGHEIRFEEGLRFLKRWI